MGGAGLAAKPATLGRALLRLARGLCCPSGRFDLSLAPTASELRGSLSGSLHKPLGPEESQP